MLTATDAIVDSLDKWIAAIRRSDFVQAKFHAERLQLDGALLTVHPEFVNSLRKNCPSVDAAVLLSDFGLFLLCAGRCGNTTAPTADSTHANLAERRLS